MKSPGSEIEEAERRRRQYGRYAYRVPRLGGIDPASVPVRGAIEKRRQELVDAYVEEQARLEADQLIERSRRCAAEPSGALAISIRAAIERRRRLIIEAYAEERARDQVQEQIDRQLAARSRMPVGQLMELAAEVTGIPVDAITGRQHALEIVRRRHFAIWLVSEFRPDLSHQAIGAMFGARDHTSIGHALRQQRSRLNHPQVRAWLEDSRIRRVLDARPQTGQAQEMAR